MSSEIRESQTASSGSVQQQQHGSGDKTRALAKLLLDRYFRTVDYPYTRHQIDSYDQFLSTDMRLIVQNANPIIIFKDIHMRQASPDPADKGAPYIDSNGSVIYKYKVEIFVGGERSDEFKISTPTISLQNTEEVRLLLPNEARLRNMTYALSVSANIFIRVTYTPVPGEKPVIWERRYDDYSFFKIPLMLHSRYCMLHGKPKEFLEQAGECSLDHGGYFVVDGAEKVLITLQESAFNTLYISLQPADPKVSTYANIACLSPSSRIVKRIAFYYMRDTDTIYVSIPFVRKPVPLFILFRALGVQADEDIFRLVFPDMNSAEAKLLLPRLEPSVGDALPFVNTWSAVQYIKTLTKGFGEAHVIDILRNQFFIHVENRPGARVAFLGECVRQFLRVQAGIDAPTNKDDTRNQRCGTSGFLIQMLFAGLYKDWVKAINKTISEEYNYNAKSLYVGERFFDMFAPGNVNRLLKQGMISDGLTRGFKGRWGSGLGEEKSGVLQALSRQSYLDFMSHCRRVVLKFDTSMKLTGPRHLNPSQFGYFCTSETPGGSSIGISKNLSILTYISTNCAPAPVIEWLLTKGGVIQCEEIFGLERVVLVPVYVNNGIVGYTQTPGDLVEILKLMKHTGFMPPAASISFNIRTRRVLIYLDEGRPLRPLIVLQGQTPRSFPAERLVRMGTWRELVMGTHPARERAGLNSSEFVDPLESRPQATFDDYRAELEKHRGVIEYVDPYEHNETFIATFPELIQPETTHTEIHPSTIMSAITTLIPYPNHNQSPRNQLSDAQSKQALSLYATNWRNRFDGTANVLCYGETPLTRTLYADYLGEGRLPYGINSVLALACFTGYNQEDGIIMNMDAIQRGYMRSLNYRSYDIFEEDDKLTGNKTRFANPATVPGWLDLRPGIDYGKLDERGIVRVGEYVDEMTAIVGAYMVSPKGQYKDASLTPQVWTRGRVESIVVTVNNMGLRLVKVRIVQDRNPEIGDKFSNRHGQKGTIGMFFRGHDMPRTNSGIVPDMIVNPHSIPSRMTMGQILEQITGKLAANVGAFGDGTAFMNEGSPVDVIGKQLEGLGYEKYGNEMLYDGQSGKMIEAIIFIGPIYGMRLKHMVEDKWNARGKGRREQKTRQPTGGRGNQGGLKIGEMDRDAIVCHSISHFLSESMMERSDGTSIPVCTGCGTVPIYNPKLNLAVCTLCDGPVQFSGSSASNLELIPPAKKSSAEIVNVAMPFATNLLGHELATFMNMGMRFITTRGIQKLRPPTSEVSDEAAEAIATSRNTFVSVGLSERRLPDYRVPEAAATGTESANTANSLEELQRDAERLGLTVIPKDVAGVESLQFTAAKQPTGIPLEGIEEERSEDMTSENANMGMMVAPVRTEEEMAKEVGSNGRGIAETPVLSFDTSAPAMLADGLTMPSQVGFAPPSTAAASAPRQRRSPGPLRVSNESSGPPSANAVVTVNKMG